MCHSGEVDSIDEESCKFLISIRQRFVAEPVLSEWRDSSLTLRITYSQEPGIPVKNFQ